LRAHEKHLELTCEIDPAIPASLIADENRLRQILLNLVGNAIKFTEKGEVNLRASLLQVMDESWSVQFSISDTGIGIPADRLQHIFNPFTQADSSMTRRFGGTGLGLTICSRLVNLMGGKIDVTSNPGKGSQFRFNIVLKHDPNATSAQISDGAMTALRDTGILVVDDNATNLRILGDLLTQWNMRVYAASGAQEAMSILEQHSKNNTVQLMLTDFHMPQMSGLNLIESIRGKSSTPPVIAMLTATDQREQTAHCHALGIAQYLIKPLRILELRNTLLQALNAQSTIVATSRPETVQSSISLNILLAEDNQVNQLVMQRLLTKRGHRVTIAANGKIACEAIQQNTFDLIFMDVQMPEMDGFEATADIRRWQSLHQVRIPIIALTAHAMTGDQERCIAAGMDAYMTKPVNPAELDDILRRYGMQGMIASSAVM